MQHNDVSGIPDFYAGIIERGGRYAAAKDLKVAFVLEGDVACMFKIDWHE